MATQLIDIHGFEATTTDDIARHCNTTKRTLYRYIRSKHDLLFDIHCRFTVRGISDIAAIAESEPVGRLRRLVELHLRTVATYQAGIRVFFAEMKHLIPPHRHEILKQRDHYEALWREVLEDGITSGVFVRRDSFLLTHAILGAITEIHRWYNPTGPMSIDLFAQVIADLLLYGLRSPARPRPTAASVPAQTAAAIDLPNGDAWSEEPLSSILAAATRLFSEKGYDSTTTREVAEAAGLTNGALYYHIDRKEALLFRVHQAVTTVGLQTWSRIMATSFPNAATKLTRMFESHASLVATRRDDVAVMSEEMKYLSDQHRSEVVALRDRYTDLLTAVIERAVGDHEFSTTHPRLAAITFMGMLNSIYRWYRPSGRLTPTQIGHGYALLALDGLLSRPASGL